MRFEPGTNEIVLVMDTCAERTSLASFRCEELAEERFLHERTASVALLSALREMLQAHDLKLSDLTGIGIVNGPGSFTGVRVGLAFAKGLCEATGVALAAVSRLAVLAEAAGITDGFALLSAGRDQVYVRQAGAERDGHEWLSGVGELKALLQGRAVAVTSQEMAAKFAEAGASIRLVELSARHAIEAVRRCLLKGGSDLGQTDANYVRNEEAIYERQRQGFAAK